MDGLAADIPASRGGRRPPRDDRRQAGTNGGPAGAGGARLTLPPRRAYAWIAGLLAIIDCVNVLSTLYDARRMGHGLPAWMPITWEYTSGLAQIASCWVIWLALIVAPPRRTTWRRVLPVHLGANLVFSGQHTGFMTLMRMAIYAVAGRRYGVPPFGDWVYEYRKDIIAYLVLAIILWLFARSAPKPATALSPAGRGTFDILDGPNVSRTPVSQILAVRAAGNYVEFLLDGGGRPLMRAALGEIEASLSCEGFVRTHRSWLVNPAGLRRLEAVGSGDYRLVLANGAEASLSRRFPHALEQLKAPSAQT